MRPSALRFPLTLIAAGLAACTSDDPGPSPAPTSGTPSSGSTAAAADSEEIVAIRTLTAGGTDVLAEIHPLVRAGEHVVATIDLSADGLEEAMFLGGYFGATAAPPLAEYAAVRLVDLEADEVYHVAADADGGSVAVPVGGLTVEPAGTRVQLAYAAPPEGVDQLGLFLPGGSYIDAVPVVDADVPPTAADGAEVLDLATAVGATVHPLESFTQELAGAVETVTSTEELQITLGSDVLFAVDAADLTPAAEAAIDVAAAHLSGRSPGTVSVVGHTDDVGDDAYNQDLSERRADAVATALAARIDTSIYAIEASGRGEAEPLVPNVDDEARAQNRRVTLTLTSEITTTTDLTTTGELPPFDAGPVGRGPEGVSLEATRPYAVAAHGARIVAGHLVVDLEVSALDEEVDSAFGIGFLSGIWHHRQEATTTEHPVNVAVLIGGTAVYPMDYRGTATAAGTDVWLPTADLETLGRIDGGQTRVFSVIYPEVGDVDTVTIQLGQSLGTQPFRLTDIPVS